MAPKFFRLEALIYHGPGWMVAVLDALVIDSPDCVLEDPAIWTLKKIHSPQPSALERYRTLYGPVPLMRSGSRRRNAA